jgi:hypothetical protein
MTKNTVTKISKKVARTSRKIATNRKAVSAVVSTMFLTAAVLGMGIAILYWANSWGTMASREYAKSMTDNSNAVQERIAFEHVTYSTSTRTLTVNLISWGPAKNVTIARVFVWNSLHASMGNFPQPVLRAIDPPHAQVNRLNPSTEAYFTLSFPYLAPGIYNIRIVTERGRNFDGTFAVA